MQKKGLVKICKLETNLMVCSALRSLVVTARGFWSIQIEDTNIRKENVQIEDTNIIKENILIKYMKI